MLGDQMVLQLAHLTLELVELFAAGAGGLHVRDARRQFAGRALQIVERGVKAQRQLGGRNPVFRPHVIHPQNPQKAIFHLGQGAVVMAGFGVDAQIFKFHGC